MKTIKTMKTSIKTGCAAGLAIALAITVLSSMAFAHHSMSAYDRTRTATMKGTVTEFSFSNPHAELYFDVRTDKGAIQKWTAESPNPYRLAKSGWVKFASREMRSRSSVIRPRMARPLCVSTRLSWPTDTPCPPTAIENALKTWRARCQTRSRSPPTPT